MASRHHPEYRSYAKRIIQHEMGHYVSGRINGFGFGGMSLTIMGPGLGHRGEAAIQPAESGMDSVEKVRSYLRRRAVVLYSGALAESLDESSLKVENEKAIKIIQTAGMGADQDGAKAREMFHLLRSIEHPETDLSDEARVQAQLSAIELAIWNEAATLIEAHAGAVVGVAEKLLDRIAHPGMPLVMTASELEEFPEIQAIERH
jgi:hypothetical protein